MARWPFWHYPFDSACEAWIQHVTHDVIQMLHIDPLWYVGGKRSQLKIYTMVTVPFVPLALSAVWPFAADGFLPLVTSAICTPYLSAPAQLSNQDDMFCHVNMLSQTYSCVVQ